MVFDTRESIAPDSVACARRRLAAVGAAAVAAREAAAMLATLGGGGDDYASRGPEPGGLLAAAAAAAPGADSEPLRALDAIDAALDWAALEAKASTPRHQEISNSLMFYSKHKY